MQTYSSAIRDTLELGTTVSQYSPNDCLYSGNGYINPRKDVTEPRYAYTVYRAAEQLFMMRFL